MGKMVLYTRPGDSGRKFARGEAPQADPVGAELAAMQTIADAMAALPDDGVRRRVVEWIAERFALQPKPAAQAADAAPVTPGNDPSLSVAGLEDFFDGPPAEHWPDYSDGKQHGLAVELPADIEAGFAAKAVAAPDVFEGLAEIEELPALAVRAEVEVAESLELPPVLEVPEVLEVREVLEIPEIPEVPEVLAVPEVPEIPEVLAVSQALEVLEVSEVYEPPQAAAAAPAPAETSSAAKQPVTAMIQSLAEDFRKLARDWESA